ncbi:metallophosphoesterase family protein [Ramlibacter alkalitolerans]|jgi:diadenosine tetraphosphatase ApaH/serine/threonine PP2A family protein phosphatase|uniref:Metallophosphoesterase family protein n=1 Tax=Ramlibacter alkalitolerans TaxID=2039631 RepID=A0ABS1JVH0_9BURK|nr:metallophosphoesterase family protein [Ramlibacter alkalitolerans]MBL0428303.1 metallophosphoesterase family protein [Ramlibacter alkalitolerans]
MKLALLSDLHANRRAVQACLAHAHRSGATHYAFLGDLVGYGAEPAQVLEMVMELVARGALVVRGNHDAAVRGESATGGTGEQLAVGWTRAQLDAEHFQFLASLPLTATFDDALLVHADPYKPAAWQYLDRPALVRRALGSAQRQWGASKVFCGHVHQQQLYYRAADGHPMAFSPVPDVPVPLAAHRNWLAIVGSVGQPRDGDPRAMYALFELPQSRLSFHRIAYDHRAAAAAIRAAGLPESFAMRLELGR